MNWPFGGVAIAYMGGVLLGAAAPLPSWGLWLLCAAASAAAFCSKSLRALWIYLLLIFAGWLNLASRQTVLSPHDLRRQFGEQPVIAAVRGQIIQGPVERTENFDLDDGWRTLAAIEVEWVRTGSEWRPAAGRIIASTQGRLDSAFFPGQRVEINGLLRPPRGPAVHGLFDYRAHLALRGIHFQLQTRHTGDWQVLAGARNRSAPASVRFNRWAQRVLALGLPVEDEELRLLWAMTLGWQTALNGEVSEPFMRSGTMHIFAISGLHIVLISMILVQLLRVFELPRVACGLLVIPALWFYTGATGWQPSAIRSSLMSSIVVLGWMLRRPPNLLNSLSAAAWLVLLWDPQQLFQAGFQLSFVVVLSIALMVPHAERARARLLSPDPLLPPELRPRWHRWLHGAVGWLSLNLGTSLASWLGSLPIIAYYFHLLTPVSLLANLIVVPLSGLALMSNIGALICGVWLPAVTELFNFSAWFWMHWMIRFSQWFAALPGAFQYVRSPRLIEFGLYYFLLLAAFQGWPLARQGRRWWTAGIGCLALAWGVDHFRCRQETRLTILALNGGSAVFDSSISTRARFLVDCGNARSVERTTLPALRAHGADRLDHLILTHGDAQHIAGAVPLIERLPASAVWMSPIRSRSPAWTETRKRLANDPDRDRPLRPGAIIGPWQVLHPDPARPFGQADDNAAVLRASIRGTKVLLLSDLGPAGQESLFANCPGLEADLVIAGLPRGGVPLADPYLEALKPKLVIVTDAESPASERASLAVRRHLSRPGMPVLYTSDTGALELRFRANRWSLRTAAGTVLAEGRGKSEIRNSKSETN